MPPEGVIAGLVVVAVLSLYPSVFMALVSFLNVVNGQPCSHTAEFLAANTGTCSYTDNYHAFMKVCLVIALILGAHERQTAAGVAKLSHAYPNVAARRRQEHLHWQRHAILQIIGGALVPCVAAIDVPLLYTPNQHFSYGDTNQVSLIWAMVCCCCALLHVGMGCFRLLRSLLPAMSSGLTE